MDAQFLGSVAVLGLVMLAGCSAAPGAETTPEPESRTLSVLVENRDQGGEGPVFLFLGLREGDEVIWEDNESLGGIEFNEQSIVLGRDGRFDLTVSLGDWRREYVWNTTKCRDFRVRVTVESGGAVTHRQFCGEAWLREF